MTRLTFSNGALVNVAAEKVENLIRHGFAQVEKASTKASTATKAPAKKSASSKSSK